MAGCGFVLAHSGNPSDEEQELAEDIRVPKSQVLDSSPSVRG